MRHAAAAGLDLAYQVQVSPDGRNAYSVAQQGAVIEYSRDATTGALTVIGCATYASTECVPGGSLLEQTGLESPATLAISPDGKSVYVGSQGSHALVEFSRDPETGLLKEQGCISSEENACSPDAVEGLQQPYGIAVSPEGTNVYLASFDEIDEFSRSPETGMLTRLAGENECIAEEGVGCPVNDEAVGLKDAIGVAVSPDGKNVYIAAGGTEGGGDIAAFRREPGTGA